MYLYYQPDGRLYLRPALPSSNVVRGREGTQHLAECAVDRQRKERRTAGPQRQWTWYRGKREQLASKGSKLDIEERENSWPPKEPNKAKPIMIKWYTFLLTLYLWKNLLCILYTVGLNNCLRQSCLTSNQWV